MSRCIGFLSGRSGQDGSSGSRGGEGEPCRTTKTLCTSRKKAPMARRPLWLLILMLQAVSCGDAKAPPHGSNGAGGGGGAATAGVGGTAGGGGGAGGAGRR